MQAPCHGSGSGSAFWWCLGWLPSGWDGTCLTHSLQTYKCTHINKDCLLFLLHIVVAASVFFGCLSVCTSSGSQAGFRKEAKKGREKITRSEINFRSESWNMIWRSVSLWSVRVCLFFCLCVCEWVREKERERARKCEWMPAQWIEQSTFIETHIQPGHTWQVNNRSDWLVYSYILQTLKHDREGGG